MYDLLLNTIWILLASEIINASTHNANNVWAQKQEKMTNKHLVIAAGAWPPIIFMKKGEDGKEKIESMLWDHVRFWIHARNFTYTIVRQDTWGWCTEINNCTGMLGMVNRKEVDFALGNSY